MNPLVRQPIRCVVLALFLVPALLGHGLHLLPGCGHDHLAAIDRSGEGAAHAHHHDHDEACDHHHHQDHAHFPQLPPGFADESETEPTGGHQQAHEDCFICHWLATGKAPEVATALAVEAHHVALAIVIEPRCDTSSCPRELLPRGPPLA